MHMKGSGASVEFNNQANMKTTISIIGLCVVVLGSALAQTNKDILNNVQWTSQSKTVESYRKEYPQLTNLTDDRLVVAIGNKFPQLLLTDSVFSNEFSALTISSIKEYPPVEPSDQITTRDNQVYRGVKIIRRDPDGLTISYTNSAKAELMIKLNFEDLSDALQQKYNYDQQSSLNYQAGTQQSMAELRNRLQIDSQIATASENQRIDEGVNEYHKRQQQQLQEQELAAQQKETEARQKAADAAMIEAMKPPPQINMQQNTIVY
jgi:hypothetical protein